MRALLVLNENARFGKRDGELVARALDACGIEVARSPQEREVDAVIVAGGDGTVVQALPLAIERGVPIGIIPLGTFNDLARTLGVSLDLAQACETIAAGRARAIDVGRVNGSYFVNEASIGLSARIARRQTPDVKQRFGLVGMIGSTLRSLSLAQPFGVEVRYDGEIEVFRTIQLTVANSGRFGGVIRRDDAAIDDGWLDLYSVDVRTWAQAIPIVRKILTRDPQSGQGLRTRRSARFEVLTRHPHRIAADGEPAGTTPAVFDILPKAVRVIVP